MQKGFIRGVAVGVGTWHFGELSGTENWKL